MRPTLAALLAAALLVGATGCQSDDAAKNDAGKAAKDVKDAAKDAKKDVEQSADDDN